MLVSSHFGVTGPLLERHLANQPGFDPPDWCIGFGRRKWRFLGVAYNRTLLGALTAAEKLRRWPVELGPPSWGRPANAGQGNLTVSDPREYPINHPLG